MADPNRALGRSSLGETSWVLKHGSVGREERKFWAEKHGDHVRARGMDVAWDFSGNKPICKQMVVWMPSEVSVTK